jgi:hypothetical protein
MLQSHQFRLPEAHTRPLSAPEWRLLRALMLPFEVLHCQQWAAPWG